MRVHEQGQRRAEREGGVGPFSGGQHHDAAVRLAGGRVGCLEVRRGGAEDMPPAAEPTRDVHDRDDDRQVDKNVFDERDQGRRAQAGQVGISGDDAERDDQRQVLDEGVARGAADPHHGQHRLDADELQRDVGHGGQDPGRRHREPEALRAVSAPDELARCDVAARPGDRPEPRREDEYNREHHDRVRQRVEARRAGSVDQRRHRDKGIGGINVVAKQEPTDERPEPPATQTPLAQLHRVLSRPPSGRGKADKGHHQK